MSEETRVLVGTTVAPYKPAEELDAWLFPRLEDAAHYRAEIEVDARGIEPFASMIATLKSYAGSYSLFSYDNGDERFDRKRITRITTGRNLIAQFALEEHFTHVLYLDSDLSPDVRSIPKLLELNADLAGGDVPSYCLSGEKIGGYGFDVERHWNTAGYLLVRAEVLRYVRWGSDHDLTDDPFFARACARAGFAETLVRKDCIGDHKPLAPVQERGHDLAYRR